VLVVEDDEQLRGVIGAALRRRGYTVHEAANAGEALLIAEQHLAIALLLTDVVLPRMSGVELARRLVELRPGLRVLYMSGHDPAEVLRTRLGESPAMFLAKPFTPPVLLAKLRATLAGPAGA
jgi:CheY-like chemotaxis protein